MGAYTSDKVITIKTKIMTITNATKKCQNLTVIVKNYDIIDKVLKKNKTSI